MTKSGLANDGNVSKKRFDLISKMNDKKRKQTQSKYIKKIRLLQIEINKLQKLYDDINYVHARELAQLGDY